MKKSRGITLIALVITIIVLLILAGVSLNLIAGENGILGRATKSVNATQIAEAKEQVELLVGDIVAEYFEKKYTIAENVGELVDYTKNQINGKTTPSGHYLVTADETGNITIYQKEETLGNIVITGILETDGKIKWDEKGISLNFRNLTLKLEETQTITAKLTDITGDIRWENTDDNIATIEDRGNSILVTAITEGETRVTATCGEYSTVCSIKVQNPLSENALARKINTTNFGDYVNYPIDLGIDGDQDGDLEDIDDWRIFYKDSKNNIFLIAADYVPTNQAELTVAMGKSNLLTNSNWHVYWSGLSNHGMKDVSEKVANRYMLNWWKEHSEVEYWSSQAVQTLLNPNAWDSFVPENLKSKGIEAVGAPTLEMWIASWNAKGYTELFADTNNSVGYLIGKTGNPAETGLAMSSEIQGYSDTLYFPHTTSFNNCHGYWLASPGSDGSMQECVFRALYTDIGQGNLHIGHAYALRPLICLPAGVEGAKGEDGVWMIKE